MRSVVKISLLLVALAVSACRELPDYLVGDDVIARVGREYLTTEDIEANIPAGVSGEDSVAYVKSYVEKWFVRQLKIEEANMLFPESEHDIEKLVEDYRQSLLTSRVDQYYIDKQMDKNVTDEQVAEYYNSHKADFTLDRTLVKGRVLRFDATYRQTKKLKELMQKALTSADAEKSFSDLCEKHGFKLIDNRTTWINFPDFIANLPVLAAQDNEPLLDKMGVQEMKMGKDCYYFDFTSVCRKGNVAPLEIVADNIRRILLTRRRAEVIKAHEVEILQAAEAEERLRRFGALEQNEDKGVKGEEENATSGKKELGK